MKTVERAEQLAHAHNLSLSKLAELSGIGYSTLKVARRRGTQLSVDTIECICDALGISLADFFAEPIPQTPQDQLAH